MVTAFEATILAFFTVKPSSRYDLLRTLRKRSLYWSGSSGAVYGGIDRLLKKNMLREIMNTDPRHFETTELGKEKVLDFFKVPVPALKCLSDPALLRFKLRGSVMLGIQDRLSFYRGQLEQLVKAQDILREEKYGHMGENISIEIALLTIEQIQMEYDFISRLIRELDDQ